jgi:hypothetical protein
VVFPWDFPTEHAQLSVPGTGTVHVKHAWDGVEYPERSAHEFVGACVQLLPALDAMNQVNSPSNPPLSNNPAASFFAVSHHNSLPAAASDLSVVSEQPFRLGDSNEQSVYAQGRAWHLSVDGRSNMESIFKFMSLRYYRTERNVLSRQTATPSDPSRVLKFSGDDASGGGGGVSELACITFQSRIALAELAKLQETKSIEAHKHYSVLNCQIVFPEDFPDGAAVLYTCPTEHEFVTEVDADSRDLSSPSDRRAIQTAIQRWTTSPTSVMPVVNYRSTIWFRRSDKQRSLGYEFVSALADPIQKAHTRSFTVSFTEQIQESIESLRTDISSNIATNNTSVPQGTPGMIDSHHIAPLLI